MADISQVYIRSNDHHFNTYILGSSDVIRSIYRFECTVLSSSPSVRPRSHVSLYMIRDTPGPLRQGWEAKALIGRGTRLQIKCEILRCTTTLANIRCDVSLPLNNYITIVLPLDIQAPKEM